MLRRSIGLLVAAALLLAAGCTTGSAKESDPQAEFRSVVASADAALASNDPYRAWELYRKALATTGAVDADGRIAKAIDRTKAMHLARELVKNAGSAYDISGLAQALSTYAVSESETVAAQRKAIERFNGTKAGMESALADMRKQIASGHRPSRSLGGMLNAEWGETWQRDLAPVPGELGKQLRAVAAELSRAGAHLGKASTADNEADARSALDAAEASLRRAGAALTAARAAKPELRD